MQDDSSQKQIEMNNLFQSYGVTNDDNTSADYIDSCSMYGYRIFQKNNLERLQMHIYFYTVDNTILVSKLEHGQKERHTLIKNLRQRNNQTIELSEMIGTKYEISYENNEWVFDNIDAELEEYNTINSNWEPKNTLYDNGTFMEFYTSPPEEKPIKGYGVITDYYVKRSASNITQELEIGLTVHLPDDTTQEYECIHDSDNQDKTLIKLLEKYADNEDSIMSLKGQKIPVVYDENKEKWAFHIKKHAFDIRYYLQKYYKINSEKRQHIIKKTYKSMYE